jgi:hypothetical protein
MRLRVRGAGWLAAVGLGLTLVVVACQPSAPPGFTGTQPPGPGASVAVPDGSALVAGSPTVTTDGGKVTAVGLGSAKTPDFDLPAGAAGMVVTPCSNGVNPFVTLYDAKDNKLGLIVDPTYTIRNLAGGGYYLDVATNPTCVWQIVITPG